MLSFKKYNNSNKIAEYKNDGVKKPIYFTEETNDMIDDEVYFDFDKLFNDKKLFKGLKNREKFELIEKIKNDFKKGKFDNDEITNSIKEEIKKEIDFNYGEVEIVPNPSLNRVIYITAPSGCGKSTLINKILKNYHKINPDNNIYMISRKDYDESIDDDLITRIKIDESIIDKDIPINKFSNSLVVFDDSDTFPKKILQKITNIKNDLIEVGRSYNISVIITSHQTTNYSETRRILNECHCICIFPRGSTYQSSYVLKKYFGLDKNQINKIINSKSRWLCIFKYPKMVIHEKGVYLY